VDATIHQLSEHPDPAEPAGPEGAEPEPGDPVDLASWSAARRGGKGAGPHDAA
jgi:hypothetical protein